LLKYSLLFRDKAQNTPLHNVGLGPDNAETLIAAGIIIQIYCFGFYCFKVKGQFEQFRPEICKMNRNVRHVKNVRHIRNIRHVKNVRHVKI
jgi:hypothetical protein